MLLAPPPKHTNTFNWHWTNWLFDMYKKIIHYQYGQVTLSSGTGTATFTTPENDTDYYITLTGDANETFYWATKTTTGFTINSSNGSSTANVDWSIGR